VTLAVDDIRNEAGDGPVDLYQQTAPKSYFRFNEALFGGQIDDSANVSSITNDPNPGEYTATFTNPHDNATSAGQASSAQMNTLWAYANSQTASQVQNRTYNYLHNLAEITSCGLSMGDLA